MIHLGLQDDQRPNALGWIDSAGIQRALCGKMVNDIVWLDARFEHGLSIDPTKLCTGCGAEWVTRRLSRPVTHTSYGSKEKRPGVARCGASGSWWARGESETTCSACIAILRGSSTV